MSTIKEIIDQSSTDLTAVAIADAATYEAQTSIHTAKDSPFNPDAYCSDESELGEYDTEAIFTEASVKKPAKTVFIRVHPDKQFHFYGVGILDPSGNEKVKTFDKNLYMVVPAVAKQLLPEDGFYKCNLFATITRQVDVFLWPVKIPTIGSPGAGWSTSALTMAKLAMDKWIKVIAATNGYKAYPAPADLGEPQWPKDMTRANLLEFAFHGRIIDSTGHEVIRRGRGLIA